MPILFSHFSGHFANSAFMDFNVIVNFTAHPSLKFK